MNDATSRAHTDPRRRVAVTVPFVLACFGPPYALLWGFVRGEPLYGLGLLAATALALAIGRHARRAPSLRVPVNMTAGSLYVVATLLAVGSGGATSTAFCWYASLVALVVFLGSRRDGQTWAIVCVVTIAGFAIAARLGVSFPNRSDSPTAQLVQAISLAGNAAIVYAFARMFRNAERAALSALTREHDELVKAKAAEAKAARKTQLLLESVAEGVIGIDMNGHVTFINAAAAATLELSSEESIGKSFQSLCLPKEADAAAFLPDAAQAPLQEAKFQRGGEDVPVEYRISRVKETSGKTIGAVITFRDVSVERELEAQLVQAQKLEAIGRLAAGVAHEINTPAQFVSNNVSFLNTSLNKLSDPLRKAISELPDTGKRNSPRRRATWMVDQIPRALEQAQEGISRVATIVAALKEFSHPGDEQHAPVDLNRIAETTIIVARGEWKSVAEVSMDLREDLPTISGDAQELSQSLLNLIINAAHAIGDAQPDAPGHIVVRSGFDQNNVWLEVEDDGPGIPEEIRGKVFDPFFTTKVVGRGTGQGLALVRATLKKHGGRVELDTTVGQGSRFRFVFPRQGARKEDAAA